MFVMQRNMMQQQQEQQQAHQQMAIEREAKSTEQDVSKGGVQLMKNMLEDPVSREKMEVEYI
jgi:hypothetical protein